MAPAVKEAQRDHVDQFLERLHDIPGLDRDAEAIVDRINSLQRRLRRDFEETLRAQGLTWPEWKTLGSLIFDDDHCCSPGELSNELEVSTGAMTNRIDRLEEAGLVRRLRDPDDRRGVKVELTEAGRKAWTDATSLQASREARIASALSKREQDQLNGLLRKLMLQFEQ
jgi:DNA-binding MarR family transcriptional regulator